MGHSSVGTSLPLTRRFTIAQAVITLFWGRYITWGYLAYNLRILNGADARNRLRRKTLVRYDVCLIAARCEAERRKFCLGRRAVQAE